MAKQKNMMGLGRKFQSNLFYNILNMFSEIKYNPENLNVILFKNVYTFSSTKEKYSLFNII